MKYSIELICDLILHDICIKRNSTISYSKLCHMLYYVDVAHMVQHNKYLFDGNFEAWVFCPVNMTIHKKIMADNIYEEITKDKISPAFSWELCNEELKTFISNFLDAYLGYSLDYYIQMLRREYPYYIAREGYENNERCTKEIDKRLCKVYYRGMHKLMEKCEKARQEYL